MEVLMGKSTINGPFSMAMLNYQRVYLVDVNPNLVRLESGHVFTHRGIRRACLVWRLEEGRYLLKKTQQRWHIFWGWQNRCMFKTTISYMDGNGMNPIAIAASMSDESPVAGILRLKWWLNCDHSYLGYSRRHGPSYKSLSDCWNLIEVQLVSDFIPINSPESL